MSQATLFPGFALEVMFLLILERERKTSIGYLPLAPSPGTNPQASMYPDQESNQ